MHQGKDTFNKDDEAFLKETAQQSMAFFIAQRERFEKIDALFFSDRI